MENEGVTGSGGQESRCPWCAAEIAEPGAARCPACGATLHGDDRAGIPGVTELDPAVIRRPPPAPTPTSLGSLLMGGADTPRPGPDELPALAAPDDAVRLEMMRLELAAERAVLEHEVAGLEAEEAVRRAEAESKGRPWSQSAAERAPVPAPDPASAPQDSDAGPVDASRSPE
jgi:hypothetical protein